MGALSCGFKNYYRNLRFMSITLKICLFITFNHGTIIQTFVLFHALIQLLPWLGAVVAVQTDFTESLPQKKVPRKPIASEFYLNWSFHRNKLYHKCSWHFQKRMGGLSGSKPHFHPRLNKPVSKVLPMYRYIVATIYFSGEIFSQTISDFKYDFQIALEAKN